jgi:hypothetical protein
MSTEVILDDQSNKTTSSSKVLTEDQTVSLTSAIHDILSAEVEEEEDVSDIIEYAIAVIQNGKSVDYCMDELSGMGLLTSETIEHIGKILNEFLLSLSENKSAAIDGSTADSDVTGRIAVIKTSSRENALTMSGALSSARPGEKKEQKQQDKKQQLRKKQGKRGGQDSYANKNEARSDAVSSENAVANINNKQSTSNSKVNNRKRSLASEAFSRLAKKQPKNDDSGRQKQQQPTKQQQQQQWRFEVNDKEDQEARNKQQKLSPSPRSKNIAVSKKRNIPQQQTTSQQDHRQGATRNSGKKQRLPPRNINDMNASSDKQVKVLLHKAPEKEEEQDFIPAVTEYNGNPNNINTGHQFYEGPSFYNYRGRRGGGPGRGYNPITSSAPSQRQTSLTYVRGAAATTAVDDGGVPPFLNNDGLQQDQAAPMVVHPFRGGGRGGRFYGYHHPVPVPIVYEDVSKKIEQKKWVRPKAAAEEKTSET